MLKGFHEWKQPNYTEFQASSGMEGQVGEMNCSSDQLPYSFLNLNLETSMDQSLPFESALSSIVSSPGASNAAIPTGGVAIRELIGKLGGLCNSGEISPELQTFGGSGVAYMCGNNSAEPSCYSTPINSPPKLNLSIMDHHVRGSLPMVNSMPTHPSLAPFPADPGFAERAARHACVGIRSFNGLMNPFGSNDAEFPYQTMPIMENGRLSRVSSSQSLKAGGQFGNMVNKDAMLQDRLDTTSASDRKFSRSSRPSTPDNVEFTSPRDDSSASEQILGGEPRHDVNARKRKAATRGKVKELPSSPVTKDAKVAAEDEDPSTKRCKQAKSKGNDEDCAKGKEEPNGSTSTAGDGNQKETKDNPKPPEPPKDYIHVRARRGQATDSHSLAERVRREKISERMKFLQDLVPGCNKVTGKALMLDEIINYVQSLQRQVEFLSMKLASLNPKMDSNMEALFSKEMLQPRGSSLSHAVFSSDPSASAFSYAPQPQQQPPLHGGITNGLDTQCSLNPMDAALCRNISMKLHPLDGFSDVSSQALAFWEDDLQSFIQMGFGQNQEPLRSSSFHGSLPTSHMKIDL